MLGWAQSPLLLFSPGGEDPAARRLARVSNGLGALSASCRDTLLLCAHTRVLLCDTAVSS